MNDSFGMRGGQPVGDLLCIINRIAQRQGVNVQLIAEFFALE